jgi:predicted TIM-barrel fold metal-dependent hydrolase
MTITDDPQSKNAWRQVTPGHEGWKQSPRPYADDKYFMVSVDTHANEPFDFFMKRVDEKYHSRLPRIEVDDDGAQWLVCEGRAPQLVRPGNDKLKGLQPLEKYEHQSQLQPYSSRMEEEDALRTAAGASVEGRLKDLDDDGVDATIIYPNKGGMGFATKDAVFSQAMCRGWNEWAADEFFPHHDRLVPMAMIAPADVEGALEHIAWVKERGFRGVYLPVKPVFGYFSPDELQYNDPVFEPIWAALEEADLPITFHVSSGMDPRGTKGNGGAIINYVCHSMTTTFEPIVQLISSGVFERHPDLHAGSVESGIGWVPWCLDSMDYAYRAHHFWVRPVIPTVPSFYYRRNCFATFVDDPSGLALAEKYDLVDSFLWSNDYPHHEGSFPHSAASIERQLQDVSEESRAKMLGLNAARIFHLPKTSDLTKSSR